MGVIRTNRTNIVAGGLISASYVSDVYNVLTANAVEDISLSGSLTTVGSLTVTSSNSIISGSLTITGSVTVTGSNTFVGSFSQTGASTLTGVTTLTTASISKLKLTAASSSLIPDVDNTYDLGSSTKEWKDAYIDGTANMDIVSSSAVYISNTTSATTSASLHTSSSYSAVRFENLPTTKPSLSGSLWLSGSAGQGSKYLVVTV